MSHAEVSPARSWVDAVQHLFLLVAQLQAAQQRPVPSALLIQLGLHMADCASDQVTRGLRQACGSG